MQVDLKTPVKNIESLNSFADAAATLFHISNEIRSRLLHVFGGNRVSEGVALTHSVGGGVGATRGVSESVGRSNESAYCGPAGRYHCNDPKAYSIRIDNMIIESDGRLKMLNPLTKEFMDVNPANLISMPPPLMSDQRLCG